jgi:hypothetical protein
VWWSVLIINFSDQQKNKIKLLETNKELKATAMKQKNFKCNKNSLDLEEKKIEKSKNQRLARI